MWWLKLAALGKNRPVEKMVLGNRGKRKVGKSAKTHWASQIVARQREQPGAGRGSIGGSATLDELRPGLSSRMHLTYRRIFKFEPSCR